MRKKVLLIIAAVIVVLAVIVLALPFFIDVNRFKPTLETDLSGALGRKVEIGNIQLSILSGGVAVNDVSIADDPAFSQEPFLTAKQLTAGVALVPLIFSRKLAVGSFTVTEPQITLLHSASGKWNYSSLGGGGSKAPASSQSTSGESGSGAGGFSVGNVKISNGTMIVGSAGAHGKTQRYENVDLEASDISYTSQFPFQLSVKTPGGGSIKLNGKAGPVNATDSSLTPFDATLEVKGLDLAMTGFVNPSTGLGGVVDFDGEVTSDGHQMNSKGTTTANKMRLAAAGSPSSTPVSVAYNTDYDLQRQTGSLTQGDVHIGKALARLTGTYDTAGAETTVQMKLAGQGMSVPDLEGVLPALGITLPSGASLTSGTLNLDLTLSGPVDKVVIAGPVNLSNGEMTGFNLKSKLGVLGSFVGLGGGGGGSTTTIQTLSANLRIDGEGTHAQNLNLVVPTIGTITGDGNISPSNQLDCKMAAKLGASGGTGGGVGSMLGGFGGGGTKSQSGGGIPFKIQGTASNPIFLPDVAGMAGSMLKGGAGTATGAAGAASGVLGGLFGKKKNP